MNLKGLFTSFTKALCKNVKANAPTYSTGAGLIFGGMTVYYVAKKAPEAKEKKEEAIQKAKEEDKGKVATAVDVVKATAPVYAPAIATGAASAGCFIFSNHLSNKRLADANSKLATAVAGMGYLQNRIDAMNETAKEVLGENKAEDLKRKTYEKMAEKEAVNGQETVKESTKPYAGVEQLFYDLMSKQFYRSSVDALRDAENKVNMIVQAEYFDGSVDRENMAGPNEFYEIMGWDQIPLAKAWIFPPRACFNYGNKGIGMTIGKTTTMSPWGEAALVIDFLNLEERWSCET